MVDIHHALVLNMHQPSGNLEELLEKKEWEAREILFALDRMPRLLWNYEHLARVHLSLSGTLLETLAQPDFQERVYGIVKCGELLWQLQNDNIFEILGTGYYHPVLPLIPERDWEAHLLRWQGIGSHLFWRSAFRGFWPPEMGFCMELIPLLKKAGYCYVLVDCENVEPITPMSWDEIRYRPHIAEYQGHEIIVVVRDRELSNAQESGMDLEWFMKELYARTRYCDFKPLVVTCSDGDNGGWFRNTSEKCNFWSVFYQPLLEKVERRETGIVPTFIHDYLDQYGAHGKVKVENAAWNTGWHNGRDFSQWLGSPLQKDALRRVVAVSDDYHELCAKLASDMIAHPELGRMLDEAYWRLLRAETSCNFYWGEEWIWRCHRDLDETLRQLGRTLIKRDGLNREGTGSREDKA